jgi:TfoX/Sxy family transcriptional regulator of competence genes
MAQWRKPDEGLVRRLDETVAAIAFDQPVDYRPMFGCPAYFSGGNLFAGVWQDTLMLRLSEEDRAEVAAAGGRPFEPMPGRPMKEYVALPPSLVADADAAAAWVRKAAAYAASLPPKKKKKPRSKKA